MQARHVIKVSLSCHQQVAFQADTARHEQSPQTLALVAFAVVVQRRCLCMGAVYPCVFCPVAAVGDTAYRSAFSSSGRCLSQAGAGWRLSARPRAVERAPFGRAFLQHTPVAACAQAARRRAVRRGVCAVARVHQPPDGGRDCAQPFCSRTREDVGQCLCSPMPPANGRWTSMSIPSCSPSRKN